MIDQFERAVEDAADALRRGVPFRQAVGDACRRHHLTARDDFFDVANALSQRSAVVRRIRAATASGGRR